MAPGALEWRPWPRESVGNLITREADPGAMEEMATARARQPIYAGEPVINRKVVTAANGSFMSAILPQGMRAISVAISEHSAVSGFILPDDRVDVIVTRKFDADGGKSKMALTETVLSNVRVLAINQTFRQEGEDKVTVPEGKTAVLELDPRQTEVITKAEALGELSLSLRSLAEGGDAGMLDARPQLADSYKLKEERADTGPLVIRYGVETSVANP
jgi:pilus assembly protein CpaB